MLPSKVVRIVTKHGTIQVLSGVRIIDMDEHFLHFWGRGFQSRISTCDMEGGILKIHTEGWEGSPR